MSWKVMINQAANWYANARIHEIRYIAQASWRRSI